MWYVVTELSHGLSVVGCVVRLKLKTVLESLILSNMSASMPSYLSFGWHSTYNHIHRAAYKTSLGPSGAGNSKSNFMCCVASHYLSTISSK